MQSLRQSPISARPLAATAAAIVATFFALPQAQAYEVSLTGQAQTAVSGAITDTFDGANAFFDVSGGHVFDSTSAGAELTANGIYLLPGVSAQPQKGAVSPGDAWFSVGAGESATVTFGSAVNYVGFLWGSPDRYNSVSFYDHGTLIASFSGGSRLGGSDMLPGNGDQSFSRYLNFSADEITSVVFSSSSPSFELDNLSVQVAGQAGVRPAVPEPGTWALMVSGLAVTGWLARRRAARA